MMTITIIRAIYSIAFCAFLCAFIYGFIMFIKVAKRVIKALDIYIRNNTKPSDADGLEEEK